MFQMPLFSNPADSLLLSEFLLGSDWTGFFQNAILLAPYFTLAFFATNCKNIYFRQNVPVLSEVTEE